MKRGKKYTEKAKLVERATLYDTEDAIKLVQETAGAKFDTVITGKSRATGTDIIWRSAFLRRYFHGKKTKCNFKPDMALS